MKPRIKYFTLSYPTWQAILHEVEQARYDRLIGDLWHRIWTGTWGVGLSGNATIPCRGRQIVIVESLLRRYGREVA